MNLQVFVSTFKSSLGCAGYQLICFMLGLPFAVNEESLSLLQQLIGGLQLVENTHTQFDGSRMELGWKMDGIKMEM